jgi:putative transposase
VIAAARAAVPTVPASHLCALLGVRWPWYYARATGPTPQERDMALRDAIEQIVLDFPGYGYRRATHALQREGWAINHKRVLRVMRAESLLRQLKRHFVVTTNSGHAHPSYPNLLTGMIPNRLDQVWVADIT